MQLMHQHFEQHKLERKHTFNLKERNIDFVEQEV